MDVRAVIEQADRFVTDLGSQRHLATLAQTLADQDHIRTMPEGPHATDPVVCVDGAVASEQTELLTWIAAVASPSNPGADNESLVQLAAAVPITPDADRVRGAIMALSELHCALNTIQNHSRVWMDGGLITPLLSLTAGIHTHDPHAATVITETLQRSDAATLIAEYVAAAARGQVVALAKQDTATIYTGQVWPQQSGIGTELEEWLRGRRDRAIAASILQPGQYLAPRIATDALEPRAKTPRNVTDDVRAWAAVLDELSAAWRDDVDARVTYVVPRDLPDKALKIEFTVGPNQSSDDVTRERVTEAAADTLGPRTREPYAQYIADEVCKREVTSLLDEVMEAAQREFGQRCPKAVQRYRT